MAENEQTPIQFFRNLNSLPETQDGAIYVSDIETEALPTNMYVDIGNTRYLIKPSYKAGEIEELENSIDNRINFYFPSIDAWLKYIEIEREIERQDSTDDTSPIKSATLKIFALDDDIGEVFATSNGDFIRAAEINDGEIDGTFLVGDRAINIGGLDTAAYTPSGSYIPSVWSDLETEGGE